MVDTKREGGSLSNISTSLGHRKIAFIRGPKLADRQRTAVERDSEIRTLGWTGDRSRARPAATGFFRSQLGLRGRLPVHEELLQRKKRFTALMAFDDLTALGAIER